MARFYDIAERMKSGKEKPTVKIDEEHSYKINTGKSAVLYIQGISDDKKLNEVEKLDKIITTALGKEAADYIDAQDLPMPMIVTIANVIMAAIGDVELEEVEKMSKDEAKNKGKK